MENNSLTRGTVRFGSFELDLRAGELRKADVKIKLQEQPLQILAMLLEHPGQVVTREELRNRLWASDTFVDFDHSLNKAINKLREALGDSADNPHFVETLAKRGYRFLDDPRRTPGKIQSLLVLPLENLSRDPEQEYFADGLTEELNSKLARISALRVLSRTTAMHYKGVRKPLPELARELQVEGVVEGTVMRSGDRIRISAQLIHAPTDTHLWAESYERDLRDVLGLQAEVAGAIAREVAVKVTPHEQAQLARSHQVDPEAYEAYLKGRFHWNKRTIEGLKKGGEYFQQAIEKDPGYAAAYAGLADSAAILGWWGFVPPDQGCGRAKAAALKALEIDDTLADAHASLGFSLLHYDFAFLAAEREFQRALELNPRNPTAVQWHAACLTTMARPDEAVNEILRAVQLDPLSLVIHWTAGALLYHARQYDRAIAQSRRCLELEPSFPPPRWTIAIALVKKGATESAVAEMEDVVRLTGENTLYLATLAHCYGASGRRDDALSILQQLQDLSKQRYVTAYWPAVIYASLNEKDETFRWLDIAYQERSAWMVYTKIFPWFDNLRSDPRFDDLLRRMNFPP